jgi:uncharacterized protein YbaA (DUF1428 family)
MQEDERFAITGELPFDPMRLIYGGFQPLQVMGRKE